MSQQARRVESNGSSSAVDPHELPALVGRRSMASVATVTMAVTPDAGLSRDYELKTNSYDLAVDIELHDVVQRLRFEHPERQGRRGRPAGSTRSSAPAPTSRCWPARPTSTRSTSASSPTRPATRSRTPAPTLRPNLDRRGQRHRRRRRLRTGPGLRRDPADRRPGFRGVAPRSAAAGRAARHRRPHPGGRQTPRPSRPRRCLRHPHRRHQGPAGGRTGGWSMRSPRRAASPSSSPNGRRRGRRSRCAPMDALGSPYRCSAAPWWSATTH